MQCCVNYSVNEKLNSPDFLSEISTRRGLVHLAATEGQIHEMHECVISTNIS